MQIETIWNGYFLIVLYENSEQNLVAGRRKPSCPVLEHLVPVSVPVFLFVNVGCPKFPSHAGYFGHPYAFFIKRGKGRGRGYR